MQFTHIILLIISIIVIIYIIKKLKNINQCTYRWGRWCFVLFLNKNFKNTGFNNFIDKKNIFWKKILILIKRKFYLDCMQVQNF